MQKNEKNIIIVDDHQLFAEGLKRIIEDIPNFTVIDTCNNLEELKLSINKKIPHLIMLDIQMKGFNGFEICELLQKKHPFIKIIMISMFDSNDIIEKCKKVNANGYIAKTTESCIVKDTIINVLNGVNSFVNPNPRNKNEPLVVTNREKEIIELIKKGFNSNEIAKKLAISKFTVDTHRKNILKKLNLSSTAELIGYAFKNFY
ncbi:response regulator transcription factor [Siansivirga zeaxanthinifaciens]|uniref:LuxR family transcriptional regulator n=1 Tax=Siansivirga zeaxanthinifaciens CC-SAMT-1 TaxID=1454006 RepID=A0A0C5W0K4_9FLAO|nr:response regulator transcription factor [Siansivirga zeaxanthinifaciens]AJR04816.1 hypothetical protein AW14_06585 [Siansivirga zeaxanthinifaciens CC-SAMT-1]